MEPRQPIGAASSRPTEATVHITLSRDPKVDGFGYVNTRLRAPLPGSDTPVNLLNVTGHFELSERAEVIEKSEALARNRARLLGYDVRSVELEDRLKRGVAAAASRRVAAGLRGLASAVRESVHGVDPAWSS